MYIPSDREIAVVFFFAKAFCQTERLTRAFRLQRICFVESQELLKVLIKLVDDVKEKLDKLDDRVRLVEKAIAENSGRQSGMVTAKDVFVVLCGIAAVVISFVRLTQN